MPTFPFSPNMTPMQGPTWQQTTLHAETLADIENSAGPSTGEVAVYCEETQAVYKFRQGDTTPRNGWTILQTNGTGGAGRWAIQGNAIALAPIGGDNAPRITAALAAAATASVDVGLRSGVYRIDSLLQHPGGVALFGVGPATILRASAATFNVTQITGADAVIRDLRIDGAAVNDTTTQAGVIVSGVRARIENVQISGVDATHGCNNAVVTGAGADDLLVDALVVDRLQGSISGTGYGVELFTTSGAHVTRSTFTGAAAGGRHAIYISAGCTNIWIEGNRISAFNDDPIVVFATGAQAYNDRIYIRANMISNQTAGVASTSAIHVSQKSRNVMVVDNVITDSARMGIYIDTLTDAGAGNDRYGALVSRNIVRRTQDRGIYVASSSYVDIHDNEISDVSLTGAGTYPAIDVSLGDRVSIRGNVIRESNPAAQTARLAVRFLTGGNAPTNSEIVDNAYDAALAFVAPPSITWDAAVQTRVCGNRCATKPYRGTVTLNGVAPQAVAQTELLTGQIPRLALVTIGGTGTGLAPLVVLTPGTGFTLQSNVVGDTSTWLWELV